MEYITEIIKTEVKAHYDIIVVGGGPSGSAAAIAAGRKGARVLLVEKMNCLGGMWTSGLVNPLFDYDNKNGIMKGSGGKFLPKDTCTRGQTVTFLYRYLMGIG